MKVQITIIYDVIKNEISVENHDELNELQYVGLLEMAKLSMLEKD